MCVYISQKLPQPLTKQELDELLPKLKSNHVIATKIIEHSLRLVVWVARNYEKSGFEIEDLVSVGTIGLIQAVKRYNDEVDNFNTYLVENIRYEIERYIETQRRHKK